MIVPATLTPATYNETNFGLRAFADKHPAYRYTQADFYALTLDTVSAHGSDMYSPADENLYPASPARLNEIKSLALDFLLDVRNALNEKKLVSITISLAKLSLPCLVRDADGPSDADEDIPDGFAAEPGNGNQYFVNFDTFIEAFRQAATKDFVCSPFGYNDDVSEVTEALDKFPALLSEFPARNIHIDAVIQID